MIIRHTSISSTEPVTLAQAKVHLGIVASGTHDHDAYITALITAAREKAESYTGRNLVDKTVVVEMNELFLWMYLPGSPVKAITKVEYLGTDGDYVEADAADYKLLADDKLKIDSSTWTTIDTEDPSILITYTTGYGDYGTEGEGEEQVTGIYKRPYPNSIKQAILIMVRTMYDNRDDVIKGTIVAVMPKGSQFLLQPYRIKRF
jgi:uncharacterized phiE125 gp8 family phage protein